MKNKLIEILRANMNKWIDGKQLRTLLGYEDAYTYKLLAPVELRHLICELRNDGHLIVASSRGYMLTDQHNEIERYLKSRWREVKREMKQFGILARAGAFTREQILIWDKEIEKEEENNV